MNQPTSSSEQHLLYLPEHKALICRLCRHAIVPAHESVLRHFRDSHKSIELTVRKQLASYANGLEAIEPDEILIPERGTHMIEGLALLDGYECCKCRHVCEDGHSGLGFRILKIVEYSRSVTQKIDL